MDCMTLKTDVLVVGAGPVGLVLAHILKRNGLDVIVIDKCNNKPNYPRGIAINQSTLDIFELLGLKSILDSGLKVENINLFGKQKKLGQFNFKETSFAHPYFFHISQNNIEQHLENNLNEFGLYIKRGAELISYSQDELSVYAEIRENDRIISIQSTFLIGCDGGHSKVREIMGCEIDQRYYGPSFILADVVLNNYSNKETNYIFTAQGYLMIVPLPANQYRLIFSIPTNSSSCNTEQLDKKRFQQLLKERSNDDIEIESIIWSTRSKYGHRIANQVYQNRVVLAGDALHQFSPVGGTNMNVGIQDAYSLGWRLIHAINTAHPTSYFYEYELERKDVIQQQQYITEWITALITRSKQYPPLCSTKLMNDSHLIKRCLSGLISEKNRKHLQNFINYNQSRNLITKIRHEFIKVNYVLLTQGVLSNELSEKIKNYIDNRRFLTWFHQSNDDPFQFLFCRPDSIVISSGYTENVDQLLIKYI